MGKKKLMLKIDVKQAESSTTLPDNLASHTNPQNPMDQQPLALNLVYEGEPNIYLSW